jgi:hypothetical protein
MTRTKNDCWPTSEQALLLRASLLKGRDAIQAWEQWTKLVDINNIDYGSQRLLPLLYQNLLDHEVQTPLMARYKGVYRRFWLSNQLLFNRVKPVLSALYDAGIQTLLFKGAGLIFGCDLNYALRPMDDIDFLVPKEVTQIAINIIRELGWQPKFEYAADFDTMSHAAMYHDCRGHVIDLHWHSLMHDLTGSNELGYWERSFGTNIDGIPVRIMGTADLLIHICVHGIQWNPIPPIRWIADAIILLENSKTATQWDHLLEQTERLHVTLPMSHGLRYIKQELNAPIPDYVLRSLESKPVSRQENRDYQLSVKKPLPIFGGFITKITRYRKYNQKHYPFPGFLRYLQFRWGVRCLWQVPFEGVLRMWRNIRIELFNQNPDGR